MHGEEEETAKIFRETFEHFAMFQKVMPRDQTALGGESLIATAQVELAACRQEFENKVSFSQWVNQYFARFCFQTPLP